MTEEQLSEIEARANAATAGPWMWRERLANAQGGRTKRRSVREGRLVYLLTRALYPHEHDCAIGRGRFTREYQPPAWCDDPRCAAVYETSALMALRWRDIKRGTVLWNVTPPPNDEAFIARARTDIPALVAEVRRLRAALEQLRDGEVSEQPASPPEEPEPFLYCADCTAVAPVGMELEHKPMFTCGIAQAALAGGTPPSSTISER